MAFSGTRANDIDALTEHIDGLLERYLGLLDEYAKLRLSLSDLQSRVYQNIARANFSAERGVRYGQDLYDQRMQSLRRLKITEGDNNALTCTVVPLTAKTEEETSAETKETGDKPSDGKAPQENQAGDEKEEKQTTKRTDPLKWFGILIPMALRQAQAQAIESVEHIIPRLVSVDSEMAEVEIQVRRARKKRAKAEVAAEKEKEAQRAEKAGAAEVSASLLSPPPSEAEA
jgi:hypothetical protein